MRKIGIIIPAYNEERRIGKTLEHYSAYFEVLRARRVLDYEVLVMINNTTDGTVNVVKEAMKKNKRISYIDLLKGGKGYAVIEGFKDALRRDNDIVGFVDADMATSPKEFYKLIKNLDGCEGVIASRYVDGAIIHPKPTLQRIIAKRMFNLFVRAVLFLPYRDTQCGAKVFKRSAIMKVIPLIKMSQWAFDVDLLYAARRMRLKIKEIPTVWTDKEYSTINFWSAGPWMALGVLRLRILHSPFRKFIKIYDTFIGIVK